jgi:hypothetical protein
MRQYMKMKLLTSAKQTPERQDEVCDHLQCVQPKRKSVQWVRCDLCGRWSHWQCADITKVPKGTRSCVCWVTHDMPIHLDYI